LQKMLNLKGYQRALLLIALGLCVVAALPPFYVLPLAFVGFSGFFLILEKAQTKRSAFFLGWCFGVGFFGGGLYWLANAFLVNADKHGWLIPIAVPGLAAGMGVFIGITALFAHFIWRGRKELSSTLGRILLFAVAWTLIEWLRSWIFTGFPWNLIGTIWAFSDAMIQPAAWVGAFGLSLITVLAATSGAAVLQTRGKSRFFAAFLMIIVPIMMWGAGELRLSNALNEVHDGILLRLVQPNIQQKDKWENNLKAENFEEHILLSEAAGEGSKRPTHIIWPETAVTYSINRDHNVALAIASVVPRGGLVITGAPRMTEKGVKPFQVWNSLMALDELGQVQASYDKSHLVPFGEYIPFRGLIPLPKMTAGMVDFTSGMGAQTIELTGLPAFSPLICYEIIFPNHVIDDKKRPEWILNITNDGWYGDSPGPYQHLISARMRSVEEGLPVVRVANTGVTMITDAYGRIKSHLDYNIRGFIDVSLPKALPDAPFGAVIKSAIWGSLLVLSYILGQMILVYGIKRKPNL
jgi:apolipoprotein N-acyltransferase